MMGEELGFLWGEKVSREKMGCIGDLRVNKTLTEVMSLDNTQELGQGPWKIDRMNFAKKKKKILGRCEMVRYVYSEYITRLCCN